MTPENSSKIYYGWYIVLLAFVANFTSVGTSFYIFNAFMEPLSKAHGWTRTDLNMALVLGIVAGFAGQFIFGTLVMRTGPRILMFIGPLFSGAVFILLGRVNALWRFYLLYVLLYFGSMAYGGIVANTAVNNWFVLKKGKALGIATAGMSFSGAVLPFLAMILVIKGTVSDAFLWIGLFTMMVGPLSWLVVRNWPEEFGMVPDGVLLKNSKTSQVIRDDKGKQIQDIGRKEFWILRRLVCTATFWKLGLSFALVLTGINAVMSQLKPRFTSIGFGDMAAMGMMAATAFIGAFAKYIWGTLCDRFDSRRILAVQVLMVTIGLGFALIHDSLVALALFIIIFGFSMGGSITLLPILIVDIFGRQSFPAVSRYITLFLILEISGFIIAGQSFDRTGSYDIAYIVFIVLNLIALFLIATMKKTLRGREKLNM